MRYLSSYYRGNSGNIFMSTKHEVWYVEFSTMGKGHERTWRKLCKEVGFQRRVPAPVSITEFGSRKSAIEFCNILKKSFPNGKIVRIKHINQTADIWNSEEEFLTPPEGREIEI